MHLFLRTFPEQKHGCRLYFGTPELPYTRNLLVKLVDLFLVVRQTWQHKQEVHVGPRVGHVFTLTVQTCLTSLCLVLLELLVDGGDGVQQHLDLLHAAETRRQNQNQNQHRTVCDA